VCPNKILKRFGSTTSNLWRHINRVHVKDDPNFPGPPKQSLMTDHTLDGPKKYLVSSIKKKSLDNMCAMFISTDMRPLSIVEGNGFRKFVELLDPKYVLPTRATLSRTIIPRMAAEEKRRLSDALHCASFVALTTDMWSSVTCTSFLAVTVHFLEDGLTTALLSCSTFHERHTAVNITKRLLDVIADFDLSEKIVGAVTDNADNIRNAIAAAQIVGIPCFAHTLNLAIRNSLDATAEFEPLRKKIVDLATFLHRSCNGKEDFASCQVRLKMRVKVLMGDNKTRWNSTFLMLARFLELKDAVVLFQTTDSGRDYFFNQEEWEMACNVKSLLEPAYEATVELSGETYVSGSKVNE
jgi:hypothetical protein